MLDVHAADALGEAAQPLQNRVRVEACGAVGQPCQRLGVDVEALLGFEVADQGRVQPGFAGELEFVVVLGGVDGEADGGEHHRRSQGFGAHCIIRGVAPGGGSGGEVADVDPAVGAELVDLGAQCTGCTHGGAVVVGVAQQG